MKVKETEQALTELVCAANDLDEATDSWKTEVFVSHLSNAKIHVGTAIQILMGGKSIDGVECMRRVLFSMRRRLRVLGLQENAGLLDAMLIDLQAAMKDTSEFVPEVAGPMMAFVPGGATELRCVVDEMITPRPDGTIDLVPIEHRPC